MTTADDRHTFRIPDELWAAAATRAAERGESVSDVVRRALARYAKTTPTSINRDSLTNRDAL